MCFDGITKPTAFCLNTQGASRKTMKIIATRVFVSFLLATTIVTVQSIGQTTAQPKKNSLDKGDFRVGFSPKTRAKTPNKEMPKEDKAILQEIATALNSLIALPKDIYLNLDTCGEANAFYSPETAEITFCYELIAQFEQEFTFLTGLARLCKTRRLPGGGGKVSITEAASASFAQNATLTVLGQIYNQVSFISRSFQRLDCFVR